MPSSAFLILAFVLVVLVCMTVKWLGDRAAESRWGAEMRRGGTWSGGSVAGDGGGCASGGGDGGGGCA